MLNQIGVEEFFEIIENENKYAVITFFSSFDDSSDVFNDVLINVSEERDDIEFYTIDTEEASSLILEYRIEVVPSILLFKNGSLIEKLEGHHTTGELLEEIERYF